MRINKLAVLMLMPLVLSAATLRVNVIDGSSGEPGKAQRIEVLDLSQGMNEVASVMNVDGYHVFENLKVADPPSLLIQGIAGGVNYSARFPMGAAPRGTEWEVNLTVYGSSASVTDVSVEIPFFYITVLPDQLYIQKRIILTNNSNPPVTFVTPEGVIRAYLPEGDMELDFITVKSGSMPLKVTPIENDSGGYTIPKPLKPGPTEVDLAYSVPNDPSGTELKEISYYAAEHFHVFVSPASIDLSAEGLESQGLDQANNLGVYALADLPAGEEIVFTIKGAGMNPQADPHNHQESSGRIIVKKRYDQSFEAILVVLAIMLFSVGIALVWNSESVEADQEARRQALRDQRKELLAEYSKIRSNGVQVSAAEREHILNRLITIYKALEAERT